MPRAPRLLLSKSFYHVITRGNNRNTVFRTPADYDYYLQLIDRFKFELPFNLYHYCLMLNHIHLMVQINEAEDFSLFMKKINLAYFQHFQQTYGWSGHFWQGRYRSQLIGKDSYFIQCGKYIELNPVRAHLVKSPDVYRYSSYNYYAYGRKDSLITPDLFYPELGKTKQLRQENYRDLIIDEIVNENYQRPVWGSSDQRYNEHRKIQYQRKKSLRSSKSDKNQVENN